MITNKLIKTLVPSLLLAGSLSSCSDWLAVDMEDSILENKLFETTNGYLSVLNGAYTKMNVNYSSTLSMGVIDVMAQYYNVSQNSNHSYYAYANFNFEQFKSTSNNLWTTQYAIISDLNALLEHCNDPQSALSSTYANYVKGEALALRAFFHFDLLRIYGPIYNEESAGVLTIPYQETSATDIQPLLPACEVMAKVIGDLTAAADLLKEDRIRTDGVMNSDAEDVNEDNSLRYRQYRMNYYAVQALLARAYLWMGDRENAYRIAKALITENQEKEVFPWTAKNQVTTSNSDRVFSSEVIFSLYNTSRVNLYNSMFKNTVSTTSILTFKGDSMEEGAEENKLTKYFDDLGDLRREYMWSVEEVEQTDENGGVTGVTTALCCYKYADVGLANCRYMIPLIRMSEVYLIAAECSDNVEEAMEYINAIRTARNCVRLAYDESTTADAVKTYITKEFMREVIGEGQLFFYYKRNAMESVLSDTNFGYWDNGYESMALSNYVWPMPEVEMNKRVTNQ